ncbi:hypothetical protein BpHYR1_003416 [Brachionus plicatilis]|uniref:Uncharacterized protein n=1 Tax=Brachionus plicatilis TaxID=10195 RepID=A0A3M7RCK7_BRAPC|nr:hypothetical protein BpHYR1_003416 [Brachionus plicatilis]
MDITAGSNFIRIYYFFNISIFVQKFNSISSPLIKKSIYDDLILKKSWNNLTPFDFIKLNFSEEESSESELKLSSKSNLNSFRLISCKLIGAQISGPLS